MSIVGGVNFAGGHKKKKPAVAGIFMQLVSAKYVEP